jgi:hypothetical protein
MSPEPFFFGVPLIARDAADDWGLVERLLALTLRSVLAQGDRDFRLLLAAHDVPDCWRALVGDDPRFAVVAADWPPEPPSAANDDGGRKKWLVKDAVRAAGGGLLMFLDADDWIDRRLVAAARAAIGPGRVGGVVADGVAVDWASGRALPMPIGDGFAGNFLTLCGSSTVARVRPHGAEVARDPHLVLGSHGDWPKAAAAGGHRLARLPVAGAYLVGTDRSHSERHGPFAGWRRAFSESVRARGAPLDAETLARFGLSPADFAAR